MLGKVEGISGKLPQNAEGDVFSDERDGDAGNKSNKVGGENRWYPAVVVAEDRRFTTVFVCSKVFCLFSCQKVYYFLKR